MVHIAKNSLNGRIIILFFDRTNLIWISHSVLITITLNYTFLFNWNACLRSRCDLWTDPSWNWLPIDGWYWKLPVLIPWPDRLFAGIKTCCALPPHPIDHRTVMCRRMLGCRIFHLEPWLNCISSSSLTQKSINWICNGTTELFFCTFP